MQFQACLIYILLMLIRFIFNFETSSPFQVCLSSAISFCKYLFVIESQFSFSFNVYATPSFKLYYFDKFDKFVLFPNILTDYFTISYCIVFLFCIYNFRTKSQFHVKWICRNKFIIIIIIIKFRYFAICFHAFDILISRKITLSRVSVGN